jgi:radical SAM superfamily enzyme YgiQ (UPF0313 family)
MAEVEYLYHKKGIRAILFFDDNLLIDAKRCVELSKALCERKLNLIWAAEGSVKVELETLEWMKKSGCYRIDFGVESGSQEILRNIGKSFSVEDSRRAFGLCRKVGIKPNAYLIFGSPGETMQTVNETVQLMSEIQPHDPLFVRLPGLWLLPETELYRMSLEKGVIREEDWLNSDETFMYTGEYSKKGLQELADEFNRQFSRKDRALFGIPRMLSNRGKNAIWLWTHRFRRLLTDPGSFLVSARRRFSRKK